MDNNRNNQVPGANDNTRQIPVQKSESQTRQMSDVRRTSANTSPTSQSTERRIPKSAERTVPNMDNSVTRQIPVQRPARQMPQGGTRPMSADAANSETKQIPVQRPARQMPQGGTRPMSADTANSETKQIPVQRPARQMPQGGARPMSADAANSETKQIPVQRPARQMPQGGARPMSADAANSETKQIPVQRPARQMPQGGARPMSADTANSETKQIPVQRPARQMPPANQNPQVPQSPKNELAHTKTIDTVATSPNVPDDDGTGTRVMKTATSDRVNDTDTTAKKKKSRLPEEKPETADGSTIVSIVKAVVYIVAVLVISVTASLFIILVGNDIYAFVKSEEVVEITIPEGADVNDVALILSNNGVIKYPSIFEWYAGKENDDGVFLAGTYSIPCNLDYEDLLLAFKPQPDEGTTWITVPEGYTTDEIINLLVENGIGTKEKYIDVINNYPFDYWFVQELDKTDWKSSGRFYRLDGYLFPDTYEFYNEASEKAVITKFLARFNVIFGKKYREAAETMDMTVDEIVILASMIEKEAGKAADFHLVSSVFHNRLQSPDFPKLESDATILYSIHHAEGERPTKVPENHDDINGPFGKDPYNTYTMKGLPPGAIANPSASSINAALTPEQTSYYFFVSDGIETYFSKTKQEHDAKVEELRRLHQSNTSG